MTDTSPDHDERGRGRGRGAGKGSGVAGDYGYACIYRFGDDDRIVEVNEYATGDEALAAAAAHPSSETSEPA